jgi:transaldolase
MLAERKIKLFVDSGDIAQIREAISSGVAQGATSNPSLVRRAGVHDYVKFCADAAVACLGKPLSVEVIAEEQTEIIRQARLLSSFGDNVFVKVPILSSMGEWNVDVIKKLAEEGVKVNVTACLTEEQAWSAMTSLKASVPSYVSVFAGRIADSGTCPVGLIKYAVRLSESRNSEVIWASIREPLNIIQAEEALCHVITVFPEMLKKIHLFGKDLHQFAIETSKMFIEDAKAAGYSL